MEPVRPITADLGMAFRADAKAEGQLVRLGGWECIGGTQPSRARWFAVELDRQNAPWAFARGEPFRTIASLELFATLLCVKLFGKEWPTGARGVLRLQGLTDNLGNTYAMTRLMSSKFPLLVILGELASQLREKAISLDLVWAPRDQNEEADALTNEDYSAFDPSRRITVDIQSVEWIILPRLLEAADRIYAEVKARREEHPRAPQPAVATMPPRSRARVPLRQRDPWWASAQVARAGMHGRHEGAGPAQPAVPARGEVPRRPRGPSP